jgi:hypothetical protein
MINDTFTPDPFKLEKVLVQQFKILKNMLVLTKKERASLLNDPDLVLGVVEEKEALLDTMTLLEDQCREIVQGLSLSLGLRSENTSIQALLPYFKPEDARRIHNLSEGISNLASQARELNRANQAIALTKLDWLKATQSFLISIFLPDPGYRSPQSGSPRQDATGLGVEFRA